MQINSGFSKRGHADFAAQVDLIVAALAGNANFPEPWPAAVVTLAQLQADQANYRELLTAIAAGDRRRVADRDAARQQLELNLRILAFYLQTMAGGDPTKLATTGFPVRRVAQRTLSAEALAPPAQVRLQHGVLSGQLVLKVRRVERAAAYDVQTTTRDPTVEANWRDAGSYTRCRRIELDGLTPGQIYWVRVRALGAAGPGAWTSPSSLMVM